MNSPFHIPEVSPELSEQIHTSEHLQRIAPHSSSTISSTISHTSIRLHHSTTLLPLISPHCATPIQLIVTLYRHLHNLQHHHLHQDRHTVAVSSRTTFLGVLVGSNRGFSGGSRAKYPTTMLSRSYEKVHLPRSPFIYLLKPSPQSRTCISHRISQGGTGQEISRPIDYTSQGAIHDNAAHGEMLPYAAPDHSQS